MKNQDLRYRICASRHICLRWRRSSALGSSGSVVVVEEISPHMMLACFLCPIVSRSECVARCILSGKDLFSPGHVPRGTYPTLSFETMIEAWNLFRYLCEH